MTDVIIFDTADGQIAFEVPDATVRTKPGVRQVSGAVQANIEKATNSLGEALSGVPQLITAIRQKLATSGIDEAEASLGLKLSGDAKFIVASAAAEASLTIKVKIKA